MTHSSKRHHHEKKTSAFENVPPEIVDTILEGVTFQDMAQLSETNPRIKQKVDNFLQHMAKDQKYTKKMCKLFGSCAQDSVFVFQRPGMQFCRDACYLELRTLLHMMIVQSEDLFKNQHDDAQHVLTVSMISPSDEPYDINNAPDDVFIPIRPKGNSYESAEVLKTIIVEYHKKSDRLPIKISMSVNTRHEDLYSIWLERMKQLLSETKYFINDHMKIVFYVFGMNYDFVDAVEREEEKE